MDLPATSAKPASPKTASSILVTGDVIRDVYIYQGDRVFPAQQGTIAPYLHDEPGGAWGLYELIDRCHSGTVSFGLEISGTKAALQAVHVLWVPCDEGTAQDRDNAPKAKKPKKVWRVGQSLGYALPGTKAELPEKAPESNENPTVLAIDDAGLAFRALPAKSLWPKGVFDRKGGPEWIVLKMASPIAQGDLWRALIGDSAPNRRENLIVVVSADELRRAGAAISRGFSWERTLSELCGELKHNPVFQPLVRFARALVVNFGCVGAVWFDMSPPPLASEVDDNKRAACDSADPDSSSSLPPVENAATLIYDPSLPEGGYKTRLAAQNPVYGHLNTFTAAIVLEAANLEKGAFPDLTRGIKHGLVACRTLRLLGHGPVSADRPGPPLDQLASILNPCLGNVNQYGECLKKLIPMGLQVISTNGRPAERTDKEDWTLAALAENPVGRPNLPLYGLAHRVALYGYSALAHLPHANFGNLLSIDRHELETLRSLRQMILQYREEKLPKQPLSIAAFGPPGAGKSFGIKEIAREVLGSEVPFLEFNLSQFDTPEDLFGAFHQIRDKALKGLVPVAFWDEFDSREYMWLQYLLAPMQDGTFEEKGHPHTIGKCLFVFAGGTSWDFEHFGPAPMPRGWDPPCENAEECGSVEGPAANASGADSPAAGLARYYKCNPNQRIADPKANDEFCLKKGPDFLSRLDGYIDVLGPNQRMKYDWSRRLWRIPDPLDITFPVRRAILLRQFLGARKWDDQLSIDRDLLRAFLHAPSYRHGARSLEKIAKQVARHQPPFRSAHLPAPQVLDQHLESARTFEELCRQTRELLTPAAVEALATAINDDYFNANPTQERVPLSALPAFTQQSNRAAALRIPHILALVGLCLTKDPPGKTKPGKEAPLDKEEQEILSHLDKHIELLAEEEHRLWVQFHEENGWTFGFRMQPEDPGARVTPFEKDKVNLRHPCITPFHEMPDDHGQRRTWQDYDRNSIRRYLHVVRLTDFSIIFSPQ